jgi:hypothetical protein
MAKTRGRPRKFSGPLQKGKTSIKGLNKTETKQVEKKIDTAIRKMSTLKMFNASASGHTAQHPEPSDVTGGQHVTEVSCIGYSSTGNENNAAVPVVQKYGPQNIVPLFLSRPFKQDNSDDRLKGYAIENYYILPKTARAMFSIERVAYEVSHNVTDATQVTASRTLPIMCRMVKFTFKTQTGTQQVLKPSEDLFLDIRTNVETGIDDVAFTRLQAKHAKVNSLKYKVLEDKSFVINQNNIITPAEFHNDNTNVVTGKPGSGTQYPNVSFQLSQRKGSKLFYENPTEAGNGPVTSTSGGIRTLCCFHFWYENGHNLLGGTGQQDAPGTEDIQIKYVCRSGFVDTL